MTATPMTLQDMLTQAQIVRHKLLTGSKAEEVDFGTHRAKFTRADANKLNAYIQELQDAIGGCPRYGAIGTVF